jgi:hypothetical protein
MCPEPNIEVIGICFARRDIAKYGMGGEEEGGKPLYLWGRRQLLENGLRECVEADPFVRVRSRV